MVSVTGGQATVKVLEAEKTKYVFGLIGSATMEIFDALYDSKSINYIGVHDERTGVHIADGYARASGNAGVFLAGQNGPGATNLVTGISQAKAAFSPIVSIAGSLSSEHIYRDAFQEVDQEALFKPITKKTWTAPSSERVPELLKEAFRTALTPRMGPVHLNLPRDVLSGQFDYNDELKPFEYRNHSVPLGDLEKIQAAAKLLKNSKKPVIIAGGGIKNAQGQNHTIPLAELLNCPIVTSPGHGDAVPFAHPLNAGQMGPRGNPVASKLVKEADVILALGTRLGFNSTFYSYDNINIHARIIHIEIEPAAIGRFFPVSIGIWGDASEISDQLLQALNNLKHLSKVDQWTAQFKDNRKHFLQDRDENAIMTTPIQPSGLFKVLRKVLPENSSITMDAGTLCLQATDALNYFEPRSLFTPLDFGLVGFSFACGLGVKLAQPDRKVISLMGDGGFGMTLSELSTAVDQGINTTTIVMNNKCWGAEKAYQRDFFNERYIGADISSPPFDQIAELYGALGIKVDSLSDLSEALSVALESNRPSVIDVSVDPSALYSFRKDSFKHRSK